MLETGRKGLGAGKEMAGKLPQDILRTHSFLPLGM